MEGATPVVDKRRLSHHDRLLESVPYADIKRIRRMQKGRSRIPDVAITTTQQQCAGFNNNGVGNIPPNNVNQGDDDSCEDSVTSIANIDDCDMSDNIDTDESVATADLFDKCDAIPEETSGIVGGVRNRIINFDSLKDMIELRCKCTNCNGQVDLSEITVGIATTVMLSCHTCVYEVNNRDSHHLIGDATSEGDGIGYAKQNNKVVSSVRKKRFIDFAEHYPLVLLMQQLGCGLQGLRAVLSHLGLTDTVGDWLKWRNIMDSVGEAQQAIADGCMRDNMLEEVSLSQNRGMSTATDTTGLLRQGVAASVDMGWQKRSSGRRYDSPYLNKKIWAERRAAEQSRAKGQTYGSGIAFGDPASVKRAPKSVAGTTPVCAACGLPGHLRKSNKLCPLNKNNVGSIQISATFKKDPKQPTYGVQPTPNGPLSMVKENYTGDVMASFDEGQTGSNDKDSIALLAVARN